MPFFFCKTEHKKTATGEVAVFGDQTKRDHCA